MSVQQRGVGTHTVALSGVENDAPSQHIMHRLWGKFRSHQRLLCGNRSPEPPRLYSNRITHSPWEECLINNSARTAMGSFQGPMVISARQQWNEVLYSVEHGFFSKIEKAWRRLGNGDADCCRYNQSVHRPLDLRITSTVVINGNLNEWGYDDSGKFALESSFHQRLTHENLLK